MTAMNDPVRSARWWPLLLILVVAAAAIAVVEARGEGDRQLAHMISVAIGALAVLLVLVWLLAFSRFRWPARGAGAGFVVGAIGLFFGLFEVRGVSGDLVPIFAWRWQAAVAAPAVAPPSASPSPSTALDGIADFPQFGGPARDGRVGGMALRRDWDAAPPVEVWRQPVGAGWSGFAVAGARAITQEQRGGDEAVVCYAAASGATLWTHKVAAEFTHPVAGPGPRATPTVHGGRVFALGSTGSLSCIDLETGARRWSVDILADNGAALPEYGTASSPLIAGDLVVVNAGGPEASLVAYRQDTGARAWRHGSDGAHWSSPVLCELAGRRQILMFGATQLTAHDAAGGAVLWSYPWRGNHPHVAMPVVVGTDRVLISSGYGTGSHLVEVTQVDGGFRTETVWRSLAMKAKFSNLVVRDGHVYGLDDGILACVDLETGEKVWKRGRYGHGQVLLVGDLLLVMAEDGAVVLVEAVPERRPPLARLPVLDGKTWNPPALAGRYLLVRNDREACCLRLAAREIEDLVPERGK